MAKKNIELEEGTKIAKHKIEERIAPGQVTLLEGKDEAKGTRRIRINDFMVADVVNGNKRLYSSDVIQAMVNDWTPHLGESRGQGRLMILSGEAEHPSDKGKKPQFLETVVKWDTLDWNGKNLNLEGDLILTSKGKDVETLMNAGVKPGASLRGFGESKIKKVEGEKIEMVDWVTMNAADLVGDPSFLNSAELIESQQIVDAETSTEDKNMSEELVKKIEEQANEKAALEKQLVEARSAAAEAEALKKQIAEAQLKADVEKAIAESTKDLPFGDKLNAMFIESMGEQEFTTVEAVKKFSESLRKQFSKMVAAGVLKGMGFVEGKVVGVKGPVLELETGTPEFASGAFQLTESVRKRENRSKSAIIERADSPAAVFTKLLLERFDEMYAKKLMTESQLLQEAEETSDLNLPYSVSRAIIEEAFPNLVAANIFDVGVIATSPTRLYYEATTGESGSTVTITDEVVTGGAEDVWYSLAHGRVVPGTVVVTSNPAGTTYVEGTDYVINYADGKIKFLTPGSIGANDVLVDYDAFEMRGGEMDPIERVKTSLSYKTIEAAADRLADQISSEAIVFSRSQLGWDAVSRTMANLIRQMRRKIDQGLLYMAFSAVKSVANNSTDPWTVGTTQSDYADLYRLLGEAAVIVANRFYEPTFYLASITNSDRLSNWEGFKRDGFPAALLNAAGFAGMVKNRPIFASTEFPDSLWIAGNRELVQHRVLQPLTIKGPFPTYATASDVTRLVAAEQYYAEEYNATESLVSEKGAFVPVEEGS